jgi:outer membrane protein assembly factor BamB
MAICVSGAVAAQDWERFRGPGARGVSDNQNLPHEWNVETGENVRFRVDLPGIGHSSPVVSGNRVFLTAALAEGVDIQLEGDGEIDPGEDSIEHVWAVLAIHKRDGRLLWQTRASAGVPRARRHAKSSRANPTPATDGKTVATILGSQGLFALDAATGEQLWHVDLGVLDPGLYEDPGSNWGHASSPVVHDGLVFAQVDRHANSFLAAFELRTGREVWRVDRVERPVWATPTIHVGEREELIVVGGNYVRGYRPTDGKELWRFSDPAEVKTPSPFVVADRIVFAGGYRGRPLYALRVGGNGDLSVPEGTDRSENLLWRSEPGGPYTSTPVAVDGRLFFVRDTGVMSVVDLESGKFEHTTRLEETFSASPVASDGHLFLAGEGGSMLVVEAGPEPRIVATHDMGEPLMATPGISDGVLYVRGRTSLWALEKSGGS